MTNFLSTFSFPKFIAVKWNNYKFIIINFIQLLYLDPIMRANTTNIWIYYTSNFFFVVFVIYIILESYMPDRTTFDLFMDEYFPQPQICTAAQLHKYIIFGVWDITPKCVDGGSNCDITPKCVDGGSDCNSNGPNNNGQGTELISAAGAEPSETESQVSNSDKGKGKATVYDNDSDFVDQSSDSSVGWQDASDFNRINYSANNPGPSNYNINVPKTPSLESINKVLTDVGVESLPDFIESDGTSDIQSRRSQISPLSIDRIDSDRVSGNTNTQFDRRNLVDIALAKQDVLNRLSQHVSLSQHMDSLREAFRQPFAQEGVYENSNANLNRPRLDCIGCEAVRQAFAEAMDKARWSRMEMHECGHESVINSPCHNCHPLLRNISWPSASEPLVSKSQISTDLTTINTGVKSSSVASQVSDSYLKYTSSPSVSSSSSSSVNLGSQSSNK